MPIELLCIGFRETSKRGFYQMGSEGVLNAGANAAGRGIPSGSRAGGAGTLGIKHTRLAGNISGAAKYV